MPFVSSILFGTKENIINNAIVSNKNKVGTIESDLDMEQFDNFMKQSKTIRKIGV